MPDVVELLADLGGVARRGSILAALDRAALDRAVRAGTVVRAGRGLYCLPEVDDAARVAGLLGGVVSHTSAALHHGWGVKTLPERPHVSVSRGRRLGARGRAGHVHRAELRRHEVDDGVTTPARTLLDCLRQLPFDEALAVADSALRESGCHQLLRDVADRARGPGSRNVRAVAEQATGLAANPFESVLRAICLTVPGLVVRPQVTIGDGDFHARADLVDERLRIVCEAPSHSPKC
ncbi:type IV toxin-antitoxin system AbiEi family antitoxin domain-containing protein [Nocardioides pantholopis]|uniref:type IV toxin-antitoxin system AbiEi family antitoxin domain-containing protein n=1 Tax=Nocardioides pantholopis TaxID=2483798 RepID=UPI0013E3822D|nr:type IV toxin-antitoxin system AbiEi family antitoxin domain-containing protein [Nocardioides pantholopis]